MSHLHLAPHCLLPPMDGASKRAWNLYGGSMGGVEGHIFVGRKVVIEASVEPVEHTPVWAWRDSKLLTSLVAVASGRDYWQLKFLTPRFRQAARAAAARKFETITLDFLYGAPLVREFLGQKVQLAIDTQNYDPAVFGAYRDAARNPLVRLLSSRAVETSRRALARIPLGTTMVHVSEADAAAYRRDCPRLSHVVVENGCTIRPRAVTPDYGEARKTLLFVGSLSGMMNRDALRHFGDSFWPQLHDIAQLCVVGSNPSVDVKHLCQRHGWELKIDVADEELERWYAAAHYAVLPFSYGAGSKLKLLEACGRGLPVLSTVAGMTGLSNPPPLVHISDDPKQWRQRVMTTSPPHPGHVEQTLAFAGLYSWDTLRAKLAVILAAMPAVDLVSDQPG